MQAHKLLQPGHTDYSMFGVLDPRCLTGSALLDCHVLKGFGIYMIGILDSLSDVWEASSGLSRMLFTL